MGKKTEGLVKGGMGRSREEDLRGFIQDGVRGVCEDEVRMVKGKDDEK